MKTNRIFSLLLLLNLMLLGLINPAIADNRQEKARSTNFGLPTHRRDGGSRGSKDSCVADLEYQKLMALIPQKTIGLSASTAPKLFFYVPELENQSTLEFVLRDESDDLMYEAFLTTEGDGIVRIEIPSEISEQMLVTDKNYHWYLSMICDRRERSRDIVVEGWMRQESLDTAVRERLLNATLVEKAEVYQEQGFWFDALSTLAEKPNSITEKTMMRQKWSEMLSAIGLAELSAEPMVETELVSNPTESW
ncbi:MAG: DUF928 domain-containing protein [Cyanobacteria bacterium J06623_7]